MAFGTPTSITLNSLLARNPDGTMLVPSGILRYSKDGGHNYFQWGTMSFGAPGEYGYRCIARRLSRSRDRVFEFSTTSQAAPRIVDAYLKTE